MRTDKLINMQGFLFSEEECMPRNNAEREAVKNAIEPLARFIVEKIEKAESAYHDYAGQHNLARQLSNFAPTNLTSLIIESLSQIEGVSIRDLSHGNVVLEVGNYQVWVKKVDEKLMPKCNRTKALVKRINQYVEGDDCMAMLILGYQLNDAQNITSIHLEYLKGTEHLWAPIDVGDMGARQLQANTIIGAPEQPEELEVKVKPSHKRGIKKAE